VRGPPCFLFLLFFDVLGVLYSARVQSRERGFFFFYLHTHVILYCRCFGRRWNRRVRDGTSQWMKRKSKNLQGTKLERHKKEAKRARNGSWKLFRRCLLIWQSRKGREFSNFEILLGKRPCLILQPLGHTKQVLYITTFVYLIKVHTVGNQLVDCHLVGFPVFCTRTVLLLRDFFRFYPIPHVDDQVGRLLKHTRKRHLFGHLVLSPS
jgi:hypothetical protein